MRLKEFRNEVGVLEHDAQQRAAVGPNAILQLAAALHAECGDALSRRVIAAAGLAGYLAAPPEGLVAEGDAARLFRATRDALPSAEADRVLAMAGGLTADYVVDNRIPRAAQDMLHRMPNWLAARVFLTAIKKHAWTFAGSGVVTIDVGARLAMTIGGNPLATPGCPWHVAVLQRMFRRVVTPSARVCHSVRVNGDVFQFVMPSRL